VRLLDDGEHLRAGQTIEAAHREGSLSDGSKVDVMLEQKGGGTGGGEAAASRKGGMDAFVTRLAASPAAAGHAATPTAAAPAAATSTAAAPAAATSAAASSDALVECIGYETKYMPAYLGARTLDFERWCRAFADSNKFQRYELEPYGNFMKVGPKIEWYFCNESGWRAKYKWGQTPRFLQAGYPMDDELLLMELVKRIKDEFGEDVNQYAQPWTALSLPMRQY
jgi:hypothetical protein